MMSLEVWSHDAGNHCLFDKRSFGTSLYKTEMSLRWGLKTGCLQVTAVSWLGWWSALMLWGESLSSLGSVSASGAQGRCCSHLPREHLLLLGHTVDLAGGLNREHVLSIGTINPKGDHSNMMVTFHSYFLKQFKLKMFLFFQPRPG